MCYRVTCPKCDRPSFSGCGRHVEQVLRDVPVEERCSCRQHAAAAPLDPAAAGSLFDKLQRLFSR